MLIFDTNLLPLSLSHVLFLSFLLFMPLLMLLLGVLPLRTSFPPSLRDVHIY